MGTIVQLLSNLFGAVGAIFGFQSKRLDLKNAPDVKAAAVAQSEVAAVDKTEAAVAKKDVDEIRKQLGE